MPDLDRWRYYYWQWNNSARIGLDRSNKTLNVFNISNTNSQIQRFWNLLSKSQNKGTNFLKQMLFFAYGDANFELQFCAFIQNQNLLADRKYKNAFLLDHYPQGKHFWPHSWPYTRSDHMETVEKRCLKSIFFGAKIAICSMR